MTDDPHNNDPKYIPPIYISPNYTPSNTGTTTTNNPTYTIPIPTINVPNGSIFTWVFPGGFTTAPPIVDSACEEVEEEEDGEEGATCRKCSDFNEYAVADRDDGTFVCFKCSHGY